MGAVLDLSILVWHRILVVPVCPRNAYITHMGQKSLMLHFDFEERKGSHPNRGGSSKGNTGQIAVAFRALPHERGPSIYIYP